MKPVICFGEIMARLSPPGHLRFRQSMPGTLEVTFAGAEANAGAAIAALGGQAEFVTALPRNEIAEACLAALRSAGLGVSHAVVRDEGRLGLYFVESGASQRAGLVVYDRESSTFSLTVSAQYDWPGIFRNAGWFHVSGISASVSRLAAETTLSAVRAAHDAGLSVSCDLNYRRKLWRWDEAKEPAELARETMSEVLSSAALVIGNGADLASVAGLPAPDEANLGDPDAARSLAVEICRRFPKVRWVAVTLRRSQSASGNRWGALLYCARDGQAVVAPTTNGSYEPYEIDHIVDRVGTGDVFSGALIYALQMPDLAAPDQALRFAVAASCLAHSVKGDFSFCSRAEVETLMRGGNGGAVSR